MIKHLCPNQLLFYLPLSTLSRWHSTNPSIVGSNQKQKIRGYTKEKKKRKKEKKIYKNKSQEERSHA